MRIRFLIIALIFFTLDVHLLLSKSADVDYSKPEEVAQKFLELYFKGDWFGACKLCACEGCEDQMSYMIRKMDEESTITDDTKCTFTLDKFELDKNGSTGKYYYSKICPDAKPRKNHISLKKVGEKWLVEYIYRRDRFL
jgi:hypothetical protein